MTSDFVDKRIFPCILTFNLSSEKCKVQKPFSNVHSPTDICFSWKNDTIASFSFQTRWKTRSAVSHLTRVVQNIRVFRLHSVKKISILSAGKLTRSNSIHKIHDYMKHLFYIQSRFRKGILMYNAM